MQLRYIILIIFTILSIIFRGSVPSSCEVAGMNCEPASVQRGFSDHCPAGKDVHLNQQEDALV
jgi:hypothetical protein